MSISPPSDIVLDVTRAADPLRRSEAAARLSSLSSMAPTARSAAAAPFADVLEQTAASSLETETIEAAQPLPIYAPSLPLDPTAELTRLKNTTALAGISGSTPSAPGNDIYQNLEALLLTSLVENMLPKSSEALFGKGSAGEIWRSMMAEQIAGQMSEAGGIGIANELRPASAAKLPSAGLV